MLYFIITKITTTHFLLYNMFIFAMGERVCTVLLDISRYLFHPRYFVCDTCLIVGNDTLSFSQTYDQIRKSWDRFFNAYFVCTSSAPSDLRRKSENHYGTLMGMIWSNTNKGFWFALFYYYCYYSFISRWKMTWRGEFSTHRSAYAVFFCWAFTILSLCCR